MTSRVGGPVERPLVPVVCGNVDRMRNASCDDWKEDRLRVKKSKRAFCCDRMTAVVVLIIYEMMVL